MRMPSVFWCPSRAVLCGALLAVGILHAGAARAQAGDRWVVIEVSGRATQQGADGAWEAIGPGAILRPGAAVKTGADGRLVVAHRNDRMTVSPDSEFEVVRDPSPSGPSIVDRLGTLLFHIEHSPGRRFEVDAPYLAAVVKGTIFTVAADGSDNTVHVARGAVEVMSSLSHERSLLRPGQTAIVSSVGKLRSLLGSGGNHGVLPSRSNNRAPGGTAVVDAHGNAQQITHTLGETKVDIAALTNGLVGGGDRGRSRAAGQGNGHRDELDRDEAAASPESPLATDVGRTGNAVGGAATPTVGGLNAVAGNPGVGAAGAGGVASAAGGHSNLPATALAATGGVLDVTLDNLNAGNLNAVLHNAPGLLKKLGLDKRKP